MTFFQSLLLGLVQGLTEFLPVSSSGHLVLIENLFKLETSETSNLFFDVLLHFGTLIAVCIAFRDDIKEMALEFFRFFSPVIGKRPRRTAGGQVPARRLLLLIVVGTLPLLLALPFKGWLESMRTMPWLVGVALIVTAILLFGADQFMRGRKTEKSAGIGDAVAVGCMQAVALIPGLSRSGSTISMGIFCGFSRKYAVRFSFLLSLPAVLGATILETVDAVQEGVDWSLLPTYLAGMVVAGVSGFFAIKLVKYVADKGKFGWFSAYCAIVGVITIVVSLVTK